MTDKTHRRDYPLPAGYPQQIEIAIGGKTYRLGWHKRSGRYRFRFQRNRKQTTRWFGADPQQAEADARLAIPLILNPVESKPAIAKPKPKRRAAKSGPAEIKVRVFGRDYFLRRDPRKQYRCKVAPFGYIYAGSDPEIAGDLFSERLTLRHIPPEAPQACVTLRSVISEWMGIKEVTVSLKRLASYRSKQNVVLKLAGSKSNIPLGDWHQKDWRDLHAKLSAIHSVRTVKEDAYFIRNVLERANKKHAIVTIEGEEVFQSVRCREEDTRVKHFDASELQKLLAAADSQWKAIILFAVNGAFEPGDLAHLKWSKIDLATGWFEGHRSKTGCWRRFKMWPETIDALSTHRKVSGTVGNVFKTQRGTAWKVANNNKSSMNTVFRDLMEEVGVYKRFRNLYGCRHSFGHFGAKMQGNDQFSMDAVLGHKSRSTSRIYQGHADDPYIDGRCEFVRQAIYNGPRAALEYNAEWLTKPAGMKFIETALANAG